MDVAITNEGKGMPRERKRRSFTVGDKLRILEEVRQPNTTMAEALRRRQTDPTTY